jgi:hypothetical protein
MNKTARNVVVGGRRSCLRRTVPLVQVNNRDDDHGA